MITPRNTEDTCHTEFISFASSIFQPNIKKSEEIIRNQKSDERFTVSVRLGSSTLPWQSLTCVSVTVLHFAWLPQAETFLSCGFSASSKSRRSSEQFASSRHATGAHNTTPTVRSAMFHRVVFLFGRAQLSEVLQLWKSVKWRCLIPKKSVAWDWKLNQNIVCTV